MTEWLKSLFVPLSVGIVSGFASSYASFQIVSHQVVINSAILADHEHRIRSYEAERSNARLEMEKVLGEIRARLAGIEVRLGAKPPTPQSSKAPAATPPLARGTLGG